MGWLDSLSAALTPATQTAAAYVNTKTENKVRSQQDFLAQLKMAQEEKDRELKRRLTEAQIRNYEEKPLPSQLPVREGDDGTLYTIDPATRDAQPITRDAGPEMASMSDLPFEAGIGVPQEPTGRRLRAPLKAQAKAPERRLVQNQNRQYVPIDEATGMGPDGKPVTGPTPEQPIVAVQGADGPTFVTRNQALGQSPANPTGQLNEQRKKEQVYLNLNDGIDRLEALLSDPKGGSTIMPSERKSRLQAAYNNVLLQAKEMYNLGVLNGPDYSIMQEILNNPTSLTGRALAGLSAEEQTARALAQIAEVRSIVGKYRTNLRQGGTTPPSGNVTREQQLWDAAVKKHGRAAVEREVGPRPE